MMMMAKTSWAARRPKTIIEGMLAEREPCRLGKRESRWEVMQCNFFGVRVVVVAVVGTPGYVMRESKECSKDRIGESV